MHEVLWSKNLKNAESAPGVSKSYTSDYPLIFEKKNCTECYPRQEHFKIYDSFKI